ncbi:MULTISPECIES: organoarsenical effux MFS transporter ArsJ [unclassified Pseudoalteromonas]|uniref:organoarsenical effux MFS transporter ArsJ n=1 Tax=unclassified Pseudoalteromonas TaxID=194690 RepID=UPI00072FD336|nr:MULTISPECIES: organoarsenical effux MFS transporter ArsJ [unclassified Pseudoalteromonas]KTD96487.1 MFS transporter permease [Pseudoalteromonas sp. H71]MBW4967959.1 organoarsenical effux MFS transporter ArsJ [Pseudoalteromonas sp. CR1]TMN79502.1 MFS transporter [Pseudoalteromonas sp. S410]TMN90698.1 MFS transporter [Pseudoalteromonas sp. S408]TMN95177.1 MFS transporter [Pseudoalteromonas sp. S407]
MFEQLANLPTAIKQYLIITGNYWAFTLTDGALRMLVVLHFHQLGYGALAIAMLFLFYEIFGVITNLVGGWLGVKLGLNKTMNIGLGLQIVALGMLCVPGDWLTVAYVMVAQALSGIAKDLNKMSAKSAIKYLVPQGDSGQAQLYKWVAILTGSKNALKGVGFFLGGLLLSLFGFIGALVGLIVLLSIAWVISLVFLKGDMGKAKTKPKFKELFSKSRAINLLSAARLCLFAARDVWFVVALPVYLAAQFKWDHWWVSGFMATWVIAYGLVQSQAPRITGHSQSHKQASATAYWWVVLLSMVTLVLAVLMQLNLAVHITLIVGLLIFGAVFAINSSLHSFLIVSFAKDDGVSLDVGFYYMANAMGRLLGTVLSGWVFQVYGLSACLWVSVVLLLSASVTTAFLAKR